MHDHRVVHGDTSVRRWWAAAACAISLLVAGCSTGHASLLARTPSSKSAPSRTPSSQAVSSTAVCGADQLHGVLARQPGVALSHAAVIITLRNISRQTCTLQGYPTVTLVDARGRRIPARQVNGSGYIFSDRGPHLVVLAPGAEGSCTVNWGNDDNPPQYAPSATMLLRLASGGILRVPAVVQLEPAVPALSVTAFVDGQPRQP